MRYLRVRLIGAESGMGVGLPEAGVMGREEETGRNQPKGTKSQVYEMNSSQCSSLTTLYRILKHLIRG